MWKERLLAVIGPLGRITCGKGVADGKLIGEIVIYPVEGGQARGVQLQPAAPYVDWVRARIAWAPDEPLEGFISPGGCIGWGRVAPKAEIQASYLQAQDTPAADFAGKVDDKLEGPWGSLKTQVQLNTTKGLMDAPAQGDHWQTEEALQVPVSGPLFVFGRFQGGYNTLTAQEATMTGQTGVGCKLKPLTGAEIQIRGCSRMSYQADPLRPDRLPTAHKDLLLELQCGYQLVGPLKLEYQGTATPALDPLDHNKVQQDVRFAIPLGEGGQFHVGAKHQWEDASAAKSWTDNTQLYLGIGLKR
jgi:hypothetical protein